MRSLYFEPWPHDLLLGVCLHDDGDEAADVPAAVLQGPGAQLVRPVHGAEVALPAHRRHGGHGRGGVTRVPQQQGSRVQPVMLSRDNKFLLGILIFNNILTVVHMFHHCLNKF